MKRILASIAFLLVSGLAHAGPAPIAVASVAELRAGNFGSYAAVQLIGWKAGTAIGGGLLTKGATGCIDNSGTVFKDAANNCFYRNYTGQNVSFNWFGAQGNAQRRYDCAATAASASVHCSAYTFVAADVGKVIAVQWAGATVAGGVTRTLISAIASISGGNAVMGVPVTTTPAGPAAAPAAVFFGTNDTVAMQAALTSTIGVATCISATPGQNYIVTSALAWGGTASVPHCFRGNRAGIMSLQGNFTSDANFVSGVALGDNSIVPGQSYNPISMSEFYFDCLNTGRDCLVMGNNASSTLENITVNNSYRNCFSVAPTTAWVDNLRVQTALFAHCGHHGYYAYLNQGSSPYFNIANMTNVEVNTYGINSAAILAAAGGPAAPWTIWSGGDKVTYGQQLGTCMYYLNKGASSPFTWHDMASFACQPGSSADGGGIGAYYWGSNISAAAAMIADGTQAHIIEGAGNPSATLGVTAMKFGTMDFENGGATISWAQGLCFAAETTGVGNAISYFQADINGSDGCSPGFTWGLKNGARMGPTYTSGAPNTLSWQSGDYVMGDVGTVTTSTKGFPWMPSVAGKPTGIPSGNNGGGLAGFVPFVYDSTNHQICAYDFGTASWQPSGCH